MQGAELQCLTEKSNGSERNRRGANKGRREVAERWTEILKTRTRWNVAVREIKRIGPHPERGRVAQCDAIVNGYSTRLPFRLPFLRSSGRLTACLPPLDTEASTVRAGAQARRSGRARPRGIRCRSATWQVIGSALT